MSYHTGTVNTLNDLKSAIESVCQAEAWSLNNGILFKDSMHIRLSLETVNATNGGGSGTLLLLYAGTGSNAGVLTGQAELPVAIGSRLVDNVITPLTFPLKYRIFCFAREVYVVIEYDVQKFQWLAFGKSTVNGLQGSGNWISGCLSRYFRPGVSSMQYSFDIGINGGGGSSGMTSGAMFYNHSVWSGAAKNDMVDHGFDGVSNWRTYVQSGRVGITALRPLLEIQPNSWNSEAVLLPIREYFKRSENKVSLIIDLEHARHTRIDNYEPGQIITLGNDRWMIFPWTQKNTNSRNGGTAIDHSGTFGWAIRYEGN